jgi:hypothetical protein
MVCSQFFGKIGGFRGESQTDALNAAFCASVWLFLLKPGIPRVCQISEWTAAPLLTAGPLGIFKMKIDYH